TYTAVRLFLLANVDQQSDHHQDNYDNFVSCHPASPAFVGCPAGDEFCSCSFFLPMSLYFIS
ncbi:MAG: hypothetical protein RSE62_22215, partial [Citrobacter sp.]